MFISIHCKFPKVADQLYSKRRTSHLADVVGRVFAAHVVPLIVPGQDRDVVLLYSQDQEPVLNEENFEMCYLQCRA